MVVENGPTVFLYKIYKQGVPSTSMIVSGSVHTRSYKEHAVFEFRKRNRITLQALLSADRAGMTGRMVLGDSRKVVYFALFCQGYSAFGLVRAQKHARRFYIATILLRIVCWVPILLSFSANALCLTPTGLLYTTEWQWTGSKETEMEIIGRTMSNYSREALEVGSDRSVFCGLIVPGSLSTLFIMLYTDHRTLLSKLTRQKYNRVLSIVYKLSIDCEF